jgi:hypothetical protein
MPIVSLGPTPNPDTAYTPTPSGIVPLNQPPPPSDTADGILSRSWRSILDLPKTLVRDLTPSAPHLPGTSGPQLAPGLAASPGAQAPIQEPELFHGFRRGASDVLDTGAEGLAWGADKVLPTGSVDLEGLRAKNKADRDAWEKLHGDDASASVGRVVGQLAATAPILGGVGGLIGRGAAAIPGAVGNVARGISGVTAADGGIGRAAQLAAQGAGTGAAQAGLTAASSDQPLSDQLVTGATTGAVAGPVIGGVTKAADVLRGYVGNIRPEVARLAAQLRALGVDVPATSLGSNPTARIMTDQMSKMPFSGADTGVLTAQRQFQRAINREMGSAADTFGPAEMKATADRLSQGYKDALAKVPEVTGGTPLVSDLATIGQEASKYTTGEATQHVGNAIREVNDAFRVGKITAEQYRSLTGSDGPLAKISDAAPSAAQNYLGRIRDALKDRLIASSSPEVAAELQQLDHQWRVMKTVQPLAGKSTVGDIAPGQLMGRVAAQSNRFDGSVSGLAYTGGGNLGTLARGGKQFMGSIPDSGTAARSQVMNFAEHPLSAALLAIPGLVSRPILSHLRSPTVAGRMIDTSLGAATPDIGRMITPGLLGPVDVMRDRQ